MTATASAPTLPRHLALAILLLLGTCFAGNHVSARLAFDNGAGLLVAILFRSGASLLALTGLLLWLRQAPRLPAGTGKWQLALGVLIALQSLCLYSAVARIPVALALLVANTFPILLALLTWALGGKPPTRRTAGIMALILFGLLFVLDLPTLIRGGHELGPDWISGLLFSFGAACVFSIGLWVTEHKLATVTGPVRSFYTILIVFASMIVAGTADLIPGGMAAPDNSLGWLALVLLSILYTIAFSSLFVFAPRLDMARNAPVMNIEPVASLCLGWMVLGQMFNSTQLIGGAIVITGIVLLAYNKQKPAGA
ncbi:EamA family transporter [Bordetella sp. J329]|jgi:drug/metabolite transporter (DMT)-like permease|uniref:EamA family transporter n=1 Tax=Kerstersia gyiorum TaxID=206506 RepID=UPI000FD7001D|nr:EamA family transporter [Kerstersia gyiorum]AZV92468.1 EamA family transporter [Bordetella sp. J329]MCH4270170.1 DMT family transporter [Kerstersia gyiorum]MCI1229785.1 DMT family transporter [Kerstersia gyiorum]